MSDRQKEQKDRMKSRKKTSKEKRGKRTDTLTPAGLEALIREIMDEQLLTDVNAMHKSDGTWASKGNAKTYSLTKNNKFKDSDLEVPARGSITKNGKIASKFGMNSGSPDKQCGKLNIDGSKKRKTRSCKDYPANYTEGSEDFELIEVDKDGNESDRERHNRLFPGWDSQARLANGILGEEAEEAEVILSAADTVYFKELIKQELEQWQKEREAKLQQHRATSEATKSKGGCTWEEFLRLNQQLVAAEQPPKN